MTGRSYYARPSVWKGFWSALGFGGRLSVGIIIIVSVGWLGLGSASALGVYSPWPYASFWAAIGWARAGWLRLPLLPLLVFGFFQDIAAIAPLGTHALVCSCAFVLAVFLYRYIETQQSTEIQILIPALVTIIGFCGHWAFASVWVGAGVNMLPIIASCLITIGIYYFVEPVFDLRDPLA